MVEDELAEAASKLRLSIKPLTPRRWSALAELFGPRGACNGCWCMYFRIGSAYRRRTAAANRRAFHAVVRRGPSPGLLAYAGETPVGWIQVTPRAAVPALAGMPRLRPIDDKPMWVITCLYVRVGYRRRGVTQALVEAAVRRARRAQAAGIEAYPLDAKRSPSSTGCGYVSTFVAAGFTESVRRSAARPVMRKPLRGSFNRES